MIVRNWLACGLLVAMGAVAQGQGIAAVEKGFAAPPDDARPMMRWWWFGPSVVRPELEREIKAMKAGGIGGFEIQPVYPLALDDAMPGFKNFDYLSEEFLGDVGFANEVGRREGMRVDMTLASGWPYGGKYVKVEDASARIKMVVVDLPAGAATVDVPELLAGERLIAAFVADGTKAKYAAASAVRLPVSEGWKIPAGAKARVALVFVQTPTGQMVKRAAQGAEGFVLDHYNRGAIETHLKVVGEPLMKAFAGRPPYAVFSDSLEVYHADWTPGLLGEFQKRRGYDLLPHLPALFVDLPESRTIRHDWGETLTELVEENYLSPLNAWAKAHGTRFRSQTYGEPPVRMSSNRLVELAEGEGPQWDRFSFTRWASSANHIYGNKVTSAESFTWLHSPAFRATPLDVKAEADRFFLLGVNQFVGHGWPYTPPDFVEPGWAFYAAAVFDDHNPWWPVMPDVTKYLQRMSYLLRQGEPANDVAVYLSNDDAWADMKPGKASISDDMKKYVTPALMQGILGSGFNVDFIDAEAIRLKGIKHHILVLPHVERMDVKTFIAISKYAKDGGRVIAVGGWPKVGARRMGAKGETGRLKVIASEMKGVVVAADDGVAAALAGIGYPADMQMAERVGAIGFVHRKMADADVYFIANTGNVAVSTMANFRTRKVRAEWMNAETGEVTAAGPLPVVVELAPYESRVLVLRDGAATEAGAKDAVSTVADLATGWSVSVRGEKLVLDIGRSWTEDEGTKFYSGMVVYARDVEVGAETMLGGRRFALDFGEGKTVEVDPKIAAGMRALLDGPIREAAVVYVNGRRVGSVWHPPYRIDVTDALRSGVNHVEVRVMNTAVNMLAGRPKTDYSALYAKYGERFTPQNMDNLQAVPSGILGGVKLVAIESVR